MALYFIATVYYYGMIAVSVYFFIMAVVNILEMRKKTVPPGLKTGPLVSVLIPCRDEEENIERCLASLLDQSYETYEILVIDDNSTDNTLSIINRMAKKNQRLRVYRGKPLPPDWYGKPFALQQLSAYARGDIILCTDADTVHAPTSVSWAVTNLETNRCDFISGYVGQILKSLGERITVPVMFFLTGFIIPTFLNSLVKSGYFSAAVGQYIVIKKEVFTNIGGFTAFKKKTSEDVYMARHVKQQGYKTEFLDITGQVQCRMYRGYYSGLEGIGKNIYDFLGKKPAILIGIALLIFLFFALPFPLLIWGILFNSPFLSHLIAVHLLFTLTWLVLFIGRSIPWYNCLLWPAMYFNLLFMVLWSFYRTVSHKGFFWKGRVVN
ncbi:MAG: glycosyltransferase family 2 protein [Spirochaetaceae bacterium]|jgi:chlorobactene glucosyltransferase|nr:glycosyltransferase family 2 protein [Spirochaetaceae bacterium]